MIKTSEDKDKDEVKGEKKEKRGKERSMKNATVHT